MGGPVPHYVRNQLLFLIQIDLICLFPRFLGSIFILQLLQLGVGENKYKKGFFSDFSKNAIFLVGIHLVLGVMTRNLCHDLKILVVSHYFLFYA